MKIEKIDYVKTKEGRPRRIGINALMLELITWSKRYYFDMSTSTASPDSVIVRLKDAVGPTATVDAIWIISDISKKMKMHKQLILAFADEVHEYHGHFGDDFKRVIIKEIPSLDAAAPAASN